MSTSVKEESQNIILKATERALELSETGRIKDATKYLHIVHSMILEFPEILWNVVDIWKVGKLLLIMYHSDVLDDEDANIRLAHLGYLYFSRAKELSEKSVVDADILFQIHKTEAVLFNTCEDCFSYSIVGFYLPSKDGQPDEVVSVAHHLANAIMPILQYSLLLDIEEKFGSFQDDEFLYDLCNSIEVDNESISKEIILEAFKIRRLLYNYIKMKVSKNDLEF